MAKNARSVKNNKNSAKQNQAPRLPQRSSKAYAPKTSSKRNSAWGGFWRFFSSKWVRRLLLLAIFFALLAWQWNNLTLWVEELARGTYGFLGWGLLLILIAVIFILCVIFRQQISAFIKRYKLYLWHKWLGAIAFFFAAWGILGLFSLGGRVGQVIVGEYAVLNVLRVLGLILLGIILVAPGTSWRVFKKLARGLANLFRMPPPRSRPARTEPSPYVPGKQERLASSVQARQELQRPRHEGGTIMGGTRPFSLFSKPKTALSTELVKPVVPDTDIKEKSTTEAVEKIEIKRTSKEKPIRPETRQVAQDVWRKYGESSALAIIDGWKIPPVDILDKAQELEFSEADNKQRAKIIEDALASYGVNTKVVQINVGPTVTQFGVEPGWDIKTKRVQEKDKDGNTIAREEEIGRTRVKVERITSLANDLALALSAPTIRIEAPVPGKPIVGVEVPNKVYSTVSLRGVVESNGFQKILSKSKLALALGKGAGGEAISDDLSKMPHLLIAGATGSGKTVCLNAIICCLLMNNTPFDTKMIMIDPKRVELTPFNSLPHLATPVIVDTDKALSTMRWLSMEMDNRYKKLAAAQTRNIDGYNKGKTGADKMPNLVLVIDELADLMMAGFDEVEHILCRLAQLARAVGIHLVVATQRPSVDVITGLIKANFPTRISFAVTSQVDSRTILDMVGAEKLLGRGDMLYAPTEAAKPKRLQGCYVSDAEVERLVYFWNGQKRADVTPLKIDEITAAAAASKKEGPAPDPLMEAVRQLADEHKQISASFLQRKLNIGYPRAARLFDKYKEDAENSKDGGAEVPGEET
jgi:S-DNA-T family DNA segregation ATPase FtsK/SpoIIIE